MCLGHGGMLLALLRAMVLKISVGLILGQGLSSNDHTVFKLLDSRKAI